MLKRCLMNPQLAPKLCPCCAHAYDKPSFQVQLQSTSLLSFCLSVGGELWSNNPTFPLEEDSWDNADSDDEGCSDACASE